MKNINYLLNPKNYIFYYNEINKFLLGGDLFYVKWKNRNSILYKNHLNSIFVINNKFSFYSYAKIIYNIQMLKNRLNLVFFGSSVRFRINGRGYRLFSQTNHILFKLGYSHVINYTLPIQYEIQKKEKYQSFYKINGIGLQNLGNILAQLKYLRLPNVYSKKGIFRKNDITLFKEDKKNFTL